eukprot:TRINITY_DN10682_c0_g1_i2.p2 TRINITY_DN10682_c0_g1~~TRINITY_DN10682_c0_g1_i2.p2  ORF type:complete len:201 (-),score=46.86 TRINITY_DN10682_c0_g1_i2:807-1409(-)
MSEVQKLLYEIADEFGKPRNTIDVFIKAFEENWYDTLDSLRSLPDETYEQLKVPKRLTQRIKEKIGVAQPSNTPPVSAGAGPGQPTQAQTALMEAEKSKLMQFEQELGQKVTELLAELKRSTITSKGFLDSLQTLSMISGNILKDPENDKFRQLKLSNQSFFAKVGQYPAGADLIKLVRYLFDYGMRLTGCFIDRVRAQG